jgi:hypothetical protein
MIVGVWTQKPPSDTSKPVARPATGETPIQHVRIPKDEWEEFKALAGRKNASVVRQFIRWYLRKPGAKLPARPLSDASDKDVSR